MRRIDRGGDLGVAPGSSISAADPSVGGPAVEPSNNDDSGGVATNGEGRVLWKRQPGTSTFDEANGVAMDRHGNVYVVGVTDGALGGKNKGLYDAWVIKFDGDGRVLWRRQPGTSESDFANGVATDQNDNVYVVGQTSVVRGEFTDFDAVVIKFDGEGRELWKRRLGTNAEDLATGVATDQDGTVYVVGGTQGALIPQQHAFRRLGDQVRWRGQRALEAATQNGLG